MILATKFAPFGGFDPDEVTPTIATSLPIERPCGIVVVTVTALPEYEIVGAPPIAALVKITPVKIAVLFGSNIDVREPVFTALPVYENEVFVVTASIK